MYHNAPAHIPLITGALLALLLGACSEDPDDNGATTTDMTISLLDMNTGAEEMSDEEPVEEMGVDLEEMPPDGGEEMPADMQPDDGSAEEEMGPGSDLPGVCEGECATQTLEVDFGGEVAPIERAVYGLSAPQTTESGQWELHIEALHGGFTGCPDQASPTPDRTLILSGLPVPGDETPLEKEDGLSATFLDFEGSFLGEQPFTRATAVEVVPVALSVCTECVGQGAPSHEEGFVALDVALTFAEGTIAGRLYATHCDSMDTAAAP